MTRQSPHHRVIAKEPKALLADVSPTERVFVLLLRRWLDGPQGQSAIWSVLSREAGEARAHQFLQAFEGFLRAISAGQSRALSRHASCCALLGDDEALLAGMVEAAGRGDQKTAAAKAVPILRETSRPAAVSRAKTLGLLIDTLDCHPVTGTWARATLH